ncbi:MAG: hypothetical protein Q4G64_09210 [bacterium]|nr:hypothetical protein [bacterium]
MKKPRIAALAAVAALSLPLAACGGGNWPHGSTDADSVACEYRAGETASRLRAIPGAQDARVTIFGFGCLDYEGETDYAHTQMWVTLGDAATGADLVAVQSAAREVFLDEVAPEIRTSDSLVIEFNSASTLQFSDGNLPLTQEEAEAIATFTSAHPDVWVVVAAKGDTPTVDDASEAWYITADSVLDAEGLTDPADFQAALEPLWNDLVTLGDTLEARTSNDDGFLPGIVVSTSGPGAFSGPLIIGFEHGAAFDPLWAEAAAIVMELEGQPDVEKVWFNVQYRERYNDAEITLAQPGTPLSERSQGLVDELYEIFDELGMPAEEPVLKN